MHTFNLLTTPPHHTQMASRDTGADTTARLGHTPPAADATAERADREGRLATRQQTAAEWRFRECWLRGERTNQDQYGGLAGARPKHVQQQ